MIPKSNKRLFIEKQIKWPEGLHHCNDIYDELEKELNEAIEKDWNIDYGTIPKGPDDAPLLIAKYKETWREGFQACKMKFEKDNPDQWISIEDRLPEPNTVEVMIWIKGETIPSVGTYWQDNDIPDPYWTNDSMYGQHRIHVSEKLVTHWMPLPKPPTIK